MRDRPATVAASLPTLDSRLCPVSSCGGARDSSDAPVGARCDLTDDPHIVAAASRQKLERLRSQRGGVRKHRSYRVVSMSRRILFVRVSWSSGRLVVVFYESCSVQSSFDQCPLGHRSLSLNFGSIHPMPSSLRRGTGTFLVSALPTVDLRGRVGRRAVVRRDATRPSLSECPRGAPRRETKERLVPKDAPAALARVLAPSAARGREASRGSARC